MAQCLIRPGSGPKWCSTLPKSLPSTCSVKCLNERHLSMDVATIDGLCCRVPPPYRVPARPEGDAEPSQAPFLLPHFLPSPSRSLPPLPAARGEAAMAGRPAGTAPSHLRPLPLAAPSWPPWPFPLAAGATPQPAEALAGRPDDGPQRPTAACPRTCSVYGEEGVKCE